MDYSKKISVVMSTYNTPVPILKEAVESILQQTLTDFEFIIIDDGSTDDSRDYLATLQDNRIRLIRNSENIGLTKSLNIGLKAAKGKYIARMDSDDISLPTRFEKQYDYMEHHPNVIMCGSRVSFIGDKKGTSGGKWRRKFENMDDYRVKLLFANPGPPHPTFFMRHETLKRHGIMYDENLRYAQDYVSTAKKEKQLQCDKLIMKGLLTELLGDVSAEEVDFHIYYSKGLYLKAAVISPDVAAWYKRLLKANSRLKIYNQRKLRRHIERIERRLIVHAFSDKMSVIEKLSLAIHYVSPVSVLMMLVGSLAGCYD